MSPATGTYRVSRRQMSGWAWKGARELGAGRFRSLWLAVRFFTPAKIRMEVTPDQAADGPRFPDSRPGNRPDPTQVQHW